MTFIQVQALGHVGRDPEMSYTPDGTPVTKFSLAVSEKSKDGKESTTWLSCSAWRGLAEMLNTHLTKGAQVFVQGKLTQRTYTTKDGKPGVSLDVQVDKFAFAGGGKSNGTGTPATARTSGADIEFSDEQPF